MKKENPDIYKLHPHFGKFHDIPHFTVDSTTDNHQVYVQSILKCCLTLSVGLLFLNFKDCLLFSNKNTKSKSEFTLRIKY